jgi:molybdenum cofactor guanylyltransferase
MHHDITGIVLAGGKSSRMGMDKSQLKIGDKTAVERAVDLMRSVCKENILSIGAQTSVRFFSLPVVQDLYPDAGPLAGIHAGLMRSGTEKNFIISCDVPLMTREMIEYLIAQSADAPVALARVAGYLEPLVGLYCKRVLPQIDRMLTEPSAARRRFSVHALLEIVDAKIVDPSAWPCFREELFSNMNDPKDYARILERLADHPSS